MRIFITATNTDIGKTYTTLKLIEALSKRGLRVGVVKPIETGVNPDAPDGTLLLKTLKKYNPTMQHLHLQDVVPITFKLPAAPYVASEGKKIDYKCIEKKISEQEELCDIVLIEGAGGLYVPVDEKIMMIDMIEMLQCDKTLLVTHCNLGCINDTILSQNALKERGLSFKTIFNCHDAENFSVTSKPYIDAQMKESFYLENDLEKLIENLKECW